ncbi:hypothetical protein Tco_1422188 [Tanacetum coccineum]
MFWSNLSRNINTTQAQQKALDDALVAPANHLEFGKCNMRLKTDIKPKEATFQVVLDALALTCFYQAFLITADVPTIYMQDFGLQFFFPKILGQEFEDLPLEQDILPFIKDLGHSRDITYLTDGMFYKKNIDYVYLLWEDLLFQIENKEAKKINKMSYPRFTKIIIDYFMSISRRNKMFWHTARDDTMFSSMRCISRHEDTQKSIQATKGTKIKSKAKVAKSDKKKQPAKKPKAKGLAVLSEVALTEAEQLKLATKRSKIQFHSSHASGSGDGVDTQKIEDEDEDDENDYDDISDEGDDDNDGNNGNDSDDSDESDDERTESDKDEIPDPNKTNKEHNKEEEEYDDEFNIEEDENMDE